MIDYRCALDGTKFFEAEGPIGVRVEVRCRKCKAAGRNPVIVPVARSGPVILRTCRCTTCKRTQTTTTPVDEPGYCMVCGTTSLVIIEEIGAPVEGAERAREPVRVPG